MVRAASWRKQEFVEKRTAERPNLNSRVLNNIGTGVAGSTSLSGCEIRGNTGAAVSGASTIAGCSITGNGSGISGATTVSGTYVANNGGHGVSGGSISASTILGHASNGVYQPTSLLNSWVMHNGGNGVTLPGALQGCWIESNGGFGVFSTGRTLAAAGCSILNNGGIGEQDLLALNNSDIYGNDWVSGKGVEMKDSVGTSGRIDFEGNWWGNVHAVEIAGKSYPSDLTFAKDFFDGSGSGFFDVWPQASGFLANSPSNLAPAFLLSVEPTPANAVNVGITTFTLTFSKAMDVNPASAMAVTFGLELPYTNHVVQPAPGWLPDGKTWRGVFSVQGDTGDRLNTIRVANARAADGFLIPDDTAHTFVIDTSGGGAANNGIALAMGTTAMKLSWTDTGKPEGAQGFNIRRSASGTPGTYQKINSAAVITLSYDDAPL
jgi:hypothetical protein